METITDIFTLSEALTILRALIAAEQAKKERLSDCELIALVKVCDLLKGVS